MYSIMLLVASEVFCNHFMNHRNIRALDVPIHRFKSKSKLFSDRFLLKSNKDILLIEEDLFHEDMFDWGFYDIILLSRDQSLHYGRCDVIHKYSKVKDIAQLLASKIQDSHQVKTICVYSPTGGVGKTSISILLTKLLMKEGKEVIYVGSEWDHHIMEKNQINHIGLYSQELLKMNQDGKQGIIRMLKNYGVTGETDIIVVNLEGLSKEVAKQFFGICDHVLLLTKGDSNGVRAISQLKNNEEEAWLGEFTNKTILLRNPMSRQGIVQNESEEYFRDSYNLSFDPLFENRHGNINTESSTANVLLLIAYNYYL